jgi:N-acetylmuramoyl-L-alanine amidase
VVPVVTRRALRVLAAVVLGSAVIAGVGAAALLLGTAAGSAVPMASGIEDAKLVRTPSAAPSPAAAPVPAEPGPTTAAAATAPPPAPAPPPADTPPTGPMKPALPLAGFVVALDPGHNRDNGAHAETRREVDAGGFRKQCNTTGTATADGYAESRFAMELADRLASRLRALGAEVRMTRDRDAGWGPCIDARGRFGAEVGADLLLSLHADGSTTPGDAGFHVIRPGYLPGWTDDVATAGSRLATAVRDALVDAGFRPSNYRGSGGIDVRTDLGTLNWADVPTVLVESHNMRDAGEAALFRSAAGQDRFAAALVQAVRGYLGV